MKTVTISFEIESEEDLDSIQHALDVFQAQKIRIKAREILDNPPWQNLPEDQQNLLWESLYDNMAECLKDEVSTILDGWTQEEVNAWVENCEYA